MKVSIKDFNVAMEVKNRGIELEIYSPDGNSHHGDLVVTKTRLIWCPGRIAPENGIAIDWERFIAYMESLG